MIIQFLLSHGRARYRHYGGHVYLSFQGDQSAAQLGKSVTQVYNGLGTGEPLTAKQDTDTVCSGALQSENMRFGYI